MTKKLFIIGNGFDLSLGLKTSYANFIQHIQNQSVNPHVFNNYQNNNLIRHIIDVKTIQNWFDVEDELFNFYHKNPTIEIIDDYIELKQALKNYLRAEQERANEAIFNQDYSSIDNRMPKRCWLRNTGAGDLLCNNIKANDNYLLVNFNYTNSVHMALKEWLGDEQYNEHNKNIYHVHGSLNEDNIALGISDEYFNKLISTHNGTLQQLTKSDQINDGGKKLIEAIGTHDEIFIFGVSCGKQDSFYYNHIAGITGKVINLYVYNDVTKEIFQSYIFGNRGGLQTFKVRNTFNIIHLKNGRVPS